MKLPVAPPLRPIEPYLFELDMDAMRARRDTMKPGEQAIPIFTKRAREAQVAKSERLCKLFPPSKIIDESQIATGDYKPQRVVYGWAYTRDFLLAYATKHNLSVDCRPYMSKKIGKDFLHYGALTDEDKSNPDVMDFMKLVVRGVVRRHLQGLTGIEFLRRVPWSGKYDDMLALYDNYNIVERDREIFKTADIDKVIEIMEREMNDCGHETELMWWYDQADIYLDLSSPY